jgi:hypothetical protein
VNNLRAKFQSQWQRDASTIDTTIQFLDELLELTELATWVRIAVRNHIANGGKIEDMDVMQLSMKPQMTTSRYAKVRAYGNHYKVTTDNEATTMATYDSGVAFIFQQPQATNEGMTLGSIQYVGVLKDIILLNY